MKTHDIKVIPIRRTCGRQEKRSPRRAIKSLYPALPCTQPDGKGSEDSITEGTAEGESEIRNEDMALKTWIYRRRVQNGKGDLNKKACRRHRFQKRQGRLKGPQGLASCHLLTVENSLTAFSGPKVVEG